MADEGTSPAASTTTESPAASTIPQELSQSRGPVSAEAAYLKRMGLPEDQERPPAASPADPLKDPAELQRLQALGAERDLELRARPVRPDDYTLPEINAEELGLPNVAGLTINENDPLLAMGREWAHQRGLSQEAFNGLVKTYMKAEAVKVAKYNEAVRGQQDILGGPAMTTQRMTVAVQALGARVGEAEAQEFVRGIMTAGQVRTLETLLRGNSPSLNYPSSGGGRKPGEPPDNWNTMSTDEKFAWGRLHQKELAPLMPTSPMRRR